MSKRFLVFCGMSLGMVLMAGASWAGGFNAVVDGELLNSWNATTCGAQLGDTYDDFCPSGACRCLLYEGKVSGNQVGKGTDATLHLTVDGGSSTSNPGCQPVFGELSFSGSKDTETINLNGSLCYPLGNADKSNARQLFQGGFGIANSSGNLAGFGTADGKFQWNEIGFQLKLTGQAQ
jgi:hypothetical protein